jgi:NitT/TauT family transport system substrate-binding protein
MGMKKVLMRALIVVIAMSAATPALAQGRTPVTILFNFYATNEHAAFAYGIQKGIYAEEGIELSIKEGTGSGPTVNAIIGDSARFGFADAAAMARAVSKDAPVKMIGNYVQTSPQAIIFFADKGYKTMKDLIGKKVSFTAGDALHQNWPALLKNAGIARDQIQEVLLASAAKQTAVMTGIVDALGGYYTSQAGLMERETGKKVAWIRYADYGVNLLTLGLIVNTKYLNDKEKALNCRMVRATTKAWAAAVKDPDGAVEALHAVFPQVNKGMKDLTKEQWVASSKHLYTKRSQGKMPGWMAEDDWKDLITLLREQGGMERARPVADYYTNEFFDCK